MYMIVLDGGLEEFVEEFSNSQVQYGYARVTDDNHGTNKYVFVNWVCDFLALHFHLFAYGNNDDFACIVSVIYCGEGASKDHHCAT